MSRLNRGWRVESDAILTLAWSNCRRSGSKVPRRCMSARPPARALGSANGPTGTARYELHASGLQVRPQNPATCVLYCADDGQSALVVAVELHFFGCGDSYRVMRERSRRRVAFEPASYGPGDCAACFGEQNRGP